ncbi:alpha/beta fold hydrolase [Actinoplanes sp. L3-i22]|uniref:alpha/beta fold hydrolase n=1 Tax=Actinoplanes sp. L3-i22 TaxID=2836373 RepID=UPI001C758251|nr:alpha/beta fold hydrolase [Actinoplanes sp. L3-i22]BCY11286.1 protease [Actinoplanes sp. L3-i22]
MTRHKRLAAGIGVLVVAAGAMVLPAPAAQAGAASSSTASPQVTWGTCVAYPDATLEAMGVPAEELPRFRALLARTDCGTVQVPLDYHHPNGRQITVAISRLRATDQRHKLGSIAVNPGGPGGSGYLMPHELALTSPQFATLSEKYDLIGFDPRGVGYSTRAECAHPGGDVVPPEIPPGPLTEATAKQIYDFQTTVNRTCWQSNATFLAQLTTANVARDLDRVRAALGLRRISYFGVSWGTLLGQVFRSLYPRSVDRMWLDSVVGPTANRLDSRFHDVTAADERKVSHWAAWVAQRDATYHLGDTTGEVVALVKRLKKRLDASPIVFSDLDEQIDGSLAAFLAVAPSPAWADAAAGLAALATAKSGDPVPDALRPIIVPDPAEPTDPSEPPADLPEQFNDVAGTAILCNDDTSPHDFPTFWKTYQSWQRDFPVAGSLSIPTQRCAGWPIPADEPFRLRRSNGSLQLSGHVWESPTPYPWIAQVQAAIGGTVFTVQDDIHGSVARVPECTEHLAAYFLTGRPDSGGCTGVTPPDTTATAATAMAATASTALAAEPATTPAGTHWSWPEH